MAAAKNKKGIGGTKEAEEKFKEILDAYETLRQFLVI